MRYNRLGDSALEVSEICLGTMTFGEQNSERDAHEQLDHAIARGVNFIDAAEMYPVPPRAETQGVTESHVGSWLAGQARDRLIVATKITGPGRGFVASTIIGATTLAQLDENIGSIDSVLPDQVLAAIDAIHLGNPNPAV